MEVEKRCNELAIQLEKAREEGEKKILEREVEILLLRREEGLKKRWEVEFEENLNWATTRSPLHVGVDERENLGSVENSHLDQSLLSELGSTWNGGVQLEQSLISSQEVASQTDLFASELEGLKQSMLDGEETLFCY